MGNEVIEAEVKEESGIQLPSLAAGSQMGAIGEIEARRAAIETLARVQVARAFPRKPQMQEIEEELKLICADPIFAEKAIYAKPAGKKDGVPQFIYGPSVFLAEEIAQNYPNYEVKPIIYGAHGEQTDCDVQIWDMEKNTRFPFPFAVTHWSWNANNQRAYLETNPQKIRQMVQAELSKIKRNLIFATTPKLLQRKCYEWCEATNRQSETALLKDRKNMMAYFSEKLEVTEEQILGYLKRKTKDEIEAKDVRLLRALVQSFKQGEVKPSDIWESAKNIPVKGEAGQKKESSTENDTSSASTSETGKTPVSQESSAKQSGKGSSKAKSGSASAEKQSNELTNKQEDSGPNTSEKNQQGQDSESATTSTAESDAKNSNSSDDSKSANAKDMDTSQTAPARQPKAVSAEEAAALEEMFK